MNTLAALSLFAVLGPVAPEKGNLIITMSNKAQIVIAVDNAGSPKTAAHIKSLVAKKFYDGQAFHRVEGWVVQWGDPLSKKTITGAGAGGSGKNMPFEASKTSFKAGVVGIASTGERVGGDSQIFIVKNDSEFLDGKYAVLGKVVSGMPAVMKLKTGDKIVSITYKRVFGKTPGK